MSQGRRQGYKDESARLQQLVATLETSGDPTISAAARELVRSVLNLHKQALFDLLTIVREAGTQPADMLLPRFAANPALRGVLLLHDLHPDELQARVGQAMTRLNTLLGPRGVHTELVALENSVVHIRAAATGQKNRRPSAAELRREIERAVFEVAPDAADLVIDGLETAGDAEEAYVPLSAISRAGSRAAGAGASKVDS